MSDDSRDTDERRSLARLVDEVHRWPEAERAQLLERCRRDLERERQFLDDFRAAAESPDGGAIADLRHALQSVQIPSMQDRAGSDDSGTRD